MNDWAPVAGLIALVVGLGGAVVALLKLRPEAGQITVIAAQGAVVVQQGVIETLQTELDRYGERLEALEQERDNLRITARDLEYENAALRERVGFLEAEVKRLTNGGTA
jgi:cell division protein FtsB